MSTTINRIASIAMGAVSFTGLALAQPARGDVASNGSLIHPQEKHFKSLRQLTFGGDNAEAYWSFTGSKLVFQATVPSWGDHCDQIFVFDPLRDDLASGPPQRISIEGGRTT